MRTCKKKLEISYPDRKDCENLEIRGPWRQCYFIVVAMLMVFVRSTFLDEINLKFSEVIISIRIDIKTNIKLKTRERHKSNISEGGCGVWMA